MSAGRITLICIAGLAVNLVGSLITKIFGLPLYLDTVGTIFIAALGGYVPGIAVGFFTHLTKSFVDPSQMYYCAINVAIAIFVTFLSRRGYFHSFGKTFLMIPAMILLSGLGDFFLENFLKASDILQPIFEYNKNLADNFPQEFADKGISVFTTYALLNYVVPSHVKKAFRTIGQKQAPLTDEMKSVVNQNSYLKSSLRTKMMAILVLSSLLLSLSISLISYLLFKETIIEDRIKTVDSMVTIMLNELDPNRIDDYLKLGYKAPDYADMNKRFYAIKNSNPDIRYMYVYRIEEDGCHVVFDLDTDVMKGSKPGDVMEFEENFMPYRDALIAGRPIPPIISDDKYGFILTLYKPLYDANGKCQCYAGVDFSLDLLTMYGRTFLIKLFTLFAGCFVFIVAIGHGFIENNVIIPVNTMAYCARNFSYDSEAAREANFTRIRKLEIRTGDEIENLYQALLMTMNNVLGYFNNLKRTKVQITNMQVKVMAMDEIAYKDSLTGVKNKAAYDKKISELDAKIENAQAVFCIVMVDVNYLKKVNDTYGHERGNEYLINACKLVCSVFGVEHVYRIGGDEFVVVIDDDRVAIAQYFVKQFKTEMERKNTNESLQPWERISAAVGVAYYESVYDKTADEVFKRADKEMYANKLAMKAQRTD